jgi:hypothetical protein
MPGGGAPCRHRDSDREALVAGHLSERKASDTVFLRVAPLPICPDWKGVGMQWTLYLDLFNTYYTYLIRPERKNTYYTYYTEIAYR